MYARLSQVHLPYINKILHNITSAYSDHYGIKLVRFVRCVHANVIYVSKIEARDYLCASRTNGMQHGASFPRSQLAAAEAKRLARGRGCVHGDYYLVCRQHKASVVLFSF